MCSLKRDVSTQKRLSSLVHLPTFFMIASFEVLGEYFVQMYLPVVPFPSLLLLPLLCFLFRQHVPPLSVFVVSSSGIFHPLLLASDSHHSTSVLLNLHFLVSSEESSSKPMNIIMQNLILLATCVVVVGRESRVVLPSLSLGAGRSQGRSSVVVVGPGSGQYDELFPLWQHKGSIHLTLSLST